MSLGDPCSRDHHIVPGRQNGRASDINEDCTREGAGSGTLHPTVRFSKFIKFHVQVKRGGFHLHFTETPTSLHTFQIIELADFQLPTNKIWWCTNATH